MGKATRSGQDVLSSGSSLERSAEKELLRKRVVEFQEKWKRAPIWERIPALQKVVDDVFNGKEDVNYLLEIVKPGTWLLELEAVSKKTRWLKEKLANRK